MRAHLQLGTTSDKPQFCLALGEGSKTGALVPHRCQMLPGPGVDGKHVPLLTGAQNISGKSDAPTDQPIWCQSRPERPLLCVSCSCSLWGAACCYGGNTRVCRASEALRMQATSLG